ncbi:hypothetical protein ACFP1I_17965 [Dyadobacter subterraneus]|uniref:DNA-binding protein n=1 Tax=Dyadobacter subterraneus TaxID=2773304 RepID=A0ABR9WGW9_9BACT|nr:hypothetical protein [Dyadobacter subterraneus]MBE9464758.1 hypothetical protein [Dyadobacter subterraneus]
MIDHVKDRLEDYLTKIKKADNSEIPKIRSEFSNWYYLLSDDEKNEIEPFWQEIKETARQTIKDIKDAINELHLLNDVKIVVAGAEYDLHEWMTISDYSRLHNLKVSRVQNWISRGVVPRDKVLAIPQLNNVKLIKNELYGALL